MKHADLVASDFLTDRAMNELCGLIQELPYDDLKELGALKHEVNEVDFSQGTRFEFPMKVDLLLFEEHLLVVELKQNYGAKEVEHKDKDRVFLKSYKVQEFDSIRYLVNGKDTLLYVRNYRCEKIIQEKSFTLKVSSDLAIEVEGILQGYLKDSQQQVELIGTKHENHECRKFRGTGNITASTTRCGECDHMMRGLFYNGIECKTCEKIYHKECFSLLRGNTFDSEAGEEQEVMKNKQHSEIDIV